MRGELRPRTAYIFGRFRLNPIDESLTRDGLRVRLAPQPYQVLTLLVGRAGELITRSEFEAALWEPNVHVDSQRGLNSCILQLREILNDDARIPRYIETVPRRGYRFITAVTRQTSLQHEGTAPPVSRRGIVGRSAVALAALVILVVVTIMTGGNLPAETPQAKSDDRVRIAVLPFKVLGAAQTAEFAEGLTDELIAVLGRPYPDRIAVVARTTSMRYVGTNRKISAIGRELGVDYIIEGSIRQEADAIRISANLVAVDDEFYIWCESYNRILDDPLTIQKDVSNRIAQSAGYLLGVLLPPTQQVDLR